jgi:hypothetical protein
MKKTMEKMASVLNNRMVYATAMMLASTNSYAGSTRELKGVFTDPNLQIAITMGFGIFAAYKWFAYFSSFNPNSALLDVILPAVLTFLTFKWTTVLGWVGIM